MTKFEIKGRYAVPIRAIPFHSPGFLDPAAVLDMLVDVEGYGAAPALHPFMLDEFGRIRGIRPLEMLYARNEVERLKSNKVPIDVAIMAMPGEVMVWFDEIETRYDFLDEQLLKAETDIWARETPRGWFDSPYLTTAQGELISAGVSDTAHPVGSLATTPASPIWPRQRNKEGVNPSVQKVADGLAARHYAKHGKWPSKKQLRPALVQHFGDKKEAVTLDREFNTTWKRH